MEEKQNQDYKQLYGLIGKNISYSFSRGYFNSKFQDEGLSDSFYTNFDIQDIAAFPDILKNNNNIKGFNVTIPYKEQIMPFLDDLDETAREVGAVNTIAIDNGKLIGHNTDYYGFLQSIKPLLQPHHKKALILGTGGASKAVAYVMKLLKINFKFVSRNPKLKQFSYSDINSGILQNYSIIINTTPLGTFPEVSQKPDLPYKQLTPEHLLFDLIYNPEETAFLKEGKKKGALTANGSTMLAQQAEQAWKIWNTTSK